MESWLRCQIGRGQFSNEYAVKGESFDGKAFSLFVDKYYVEVEEPLIEGRSPMGWVQVEVVGQENDLIKVRLPCETFENGRYVTVRQESLKTNEPHQKATG